MAVPQTSAEIIRNRFFAARTSARAPSNGDTKITAACDAASAVPHQPGPRGSPCATTDAKYTAYTTVMMIVVNAEFAKSKQHQPKISRRRGGIHGLERGSLTAAQPSP